jgi:hypothetical protein
MQSYSYTKKYSSQSESITNENGETDSKGSFTQSEFVNENGEKWSDSKTTNWEKPHDQALQYNTTDNKALKE